MHIKERQLYERQIDRFITRLKLFFYDQEMLLQAEYCHFGKHSPPYGERLSGSYQPIAVGDKWGSNWEQAWFHITGRVPESWAGRRVIARLHLGGEGCIFDDSGTPVQAISCHSLWLPEFRRDRHVIAESANGGEAVDLWIDVTAAQIFGLHMLDDPQPGDPKRYGYHEAVVQDLTLATFREDAWHLFLDASVLNNLMKQLPEDSVRRARILEALRTAANRFDESEAAFSKCRQLLRTELDKPAEPSALRAIAIGHAHIDTAWLWPLHESVKKCARTFCTQLDLIEKYPGYIFGASQAQHYQFVKDHYPALYEKIKLQVSAGRWEIQGGMWVEADCNLISGESMVRQFIHGMRFFREEFGVTVKNLWLPDVFGYSAAMPQILQLCGIDVMVTQKISWNQVNKFPHHSFVWRGIDGSEIVVHFPPEDTYNSELETAGMRRAQANFAEKGFLDEFLVVFGIGDGGGGPTEEIIESGLRQCNLEGVPQVTFDHAQHFLDRLCQNRDRLNRWDGELYLELHRGTLTTQAYVKKMNRKLELKLRELEFLYAAFNFEKYPRGSFDAMWKKLLLNQFHDIIPGSSITLVYEDTHRDYRKLTASAAALYHALADDLSVGETDTLCLVNTLSCPYRRPVALPSTWADYEILDENDQPLASQIVAGQPVIFPELAALNAHTFRRGKAQQSADSVPAKRVIASLEGFVLENTLVRYEFAADGTLKRVFDKDCRREVLAPDKSGNIFSLYEDRPNEWDAWDVDIFYERQHREQAKLQSWQLLASGPLLQLLQLNFAIGKSTISQTVTLAANSKRLEFATTVNWNERHKMLRVGFYVNVFADQASYEIQFGTVKRPTHRNTSWDTAKFEVVGHRFADLSDNQYGVALLNDCKYGHKIFDNFMELNLLRSPTRPDPEADRGEHEFTYALLPHAQPLIHSGVLSEAQQLNQPPAMLAGVDGQKLQFPCRPDSDAVVLEVLKRAEKPDALVVRLYEPRGLAVSANLLLSGEVSAAWETNLLEEPQREMPLNGGRIALHFRPFEIKTVMLAMK